MKTVLGGWMRWNKASWLAWALCALVVGLTLWQAVALLSAGQAPLTLAGNLLWSLDAMVFAAVAALIVARQPRNTIGWVLMVFPLGLAATTPLDNLFAGQLATATTVSGALWWYVWFQTWSWWLLVGPVFLIAQLFPTGRPLTPRWRWGLIAVGAYFVVFVALFVTFAPTFEFDHRPAIPNPLALPALQPVLNSGELFVLGILALALFSVATIVVRYWRAGAVERQQIRWLAYALVVFGVIYTVGGISATDTPSGNWFELALPLSVGLVPLGIAIAILRYRLWDLDILVRRTLSYTVLSATLALAYFGSVVVLQAVAQAVTGEGNNALVTVISTLLIAALFVPLRSRIQQVIDRRFNRRKYDAARTLAHFGSQARDVVALDDLSSQLVQAVDDTMQPAHVSLWVRAKDQRAAGGAAK